MAYLPPHKRHAGSTTSAPAPSPNPPPSSLSFSFRGLSVSSPRGRHRGAGSRHPRPNNKIIHATGCVSRWSPFPPFTSGPDDGDGEMLRLEPFPCAPIERKIGAKPLALAASSPGQGSSDNAGPAAAAIAEKFLPDLLAAAERAMAGDAPKDEVVKLSLVARVGKVLFQCQLGGSPVTLDALREAVKAGEDGTKSQLHKSFYTSVPSECLDDMERSAVKRMGLEFDSSKEHYHVKVFDKHRSDSTISCKCTVQEDGTLAIHKVSVPLIILTWPLCFHLAS
ncbi:hypothetical protein PR202_ga01480 [Eleusine coracana subsp. coracana]|uniref:DUF7903 domain-containing protein n=1 Tax=Eleusine coracana subsp. coracana TaxID=191504 RepID=A0AAV5BF20_ELECO|nr:hypothetical protein PR202_ga00793 [Eleusine coracana subsp. coracana]GJM85691.1 hypothetical protein PR202_ga01480 [Eleusine coracana subsp. coracana]